ncbi:MAG: PKD domain-containing protein [Promethearchaeota archaeon]
MISSVKKRLIIIFSLLIFIGTMVGTSPIYDADKHKEKNLPLSNPTYIDKDVDENKAENIENNLALSNPTYIDKEVYAVGQYYKSENKVADILSQSLDNMGNGHFHISGPMAAPFDTCTTRARLNFGFNNPYYKNSGIPASYTVKCDVSYNNWNDINGSVILSIVRDDGEWFPIFEQYDLDGVAEKWHVERMLSDEYYRDDGSMNFKIVGESITYSPGLPQYPSVRVKITNLRVELKYDIDNLLPIEELYTIGQKYNPEDLVNTLSQGNDNMGNGHFIIEGLYIPPFIKNINPKASLTFGVNNPLHVDDGRPTYTVKFSITSFNWGIDGNVVLYILRDDGAWIPIFEKYGLSLGFKQWQDRSWTNNSFEYLRGDGSMNFKLVGQSITDIDGGSAKCEVTIEDLRVEIDYSQEDIFPIEEVYTVGQYYTSEYKVENIVSTNLDNMGNGHFHIEGYLAALGDTSTTRARLNFGFINPYYENSGPPDSYIVKCTITYDNGNDKNGYVKLYVQDDQENWISIWEKTGLSSTDETWFNVTWTETSDEYYRDDGSMNFKIVGESIDSPDLLVSRKPTVRVEIYNLRVHLNYASDDLFPKDGVYTVGQYCKTEEFLDYINQYPVFYTVEVLDSQLDNMGNGNLSIRGKYHQGGAYYSGTQARLNFGFNNPYFGDYGAPDSYTISCTVTYSNNILFPPLVSRNDNLGNVTLYIQRDDGEWEGVWGRGNIYCSGGLPSEEKTWPVELFFNTDEFYRYDGSMQFKIVGESHTGTPGDMPTCYVKIKDLRVKVNYKPIPSAGGPYYGDEGSHVTLDASDSFDLNGDPLLYRWDFENDGKWDTPWSDNPIWSDAYSGTWSDDYSGTVMVEVSNSLHTDTALASIIIVNVDPILDGLSATSIDEGSRCTLSATIKDPSTLDTFLVTIDWGDGSPLEEFNYPAGTNSISETHTYSDDNPSGTPYDDYIINIIVEDDDGRKYAFYQSFTPEFKVFLSSHGGNNRGNGNFDITGFPCAILDTSTTRANLNFCFINPYYDNTMPPDSYRVECRINYTNSLFDYGGYVKLYVQDDQENWILIWQKTGLKAADKSWDVSWTNSSDDYYRDDGSMQFRIVGQSRTNIVTFMPGCSVNIEDLHVVYLTPINITVSNVAPTSIAGSDQEINEGDTTFFSGSFTDPGADEYTYYWNFGEGAGYVKSDTLKPTHVYQVPGIYTVYLKIVDDDGGVGIDSLMVTVKDITDPISTLTILPPFQGTEEPYLISAITELVITAQDGDGFGVAAIKYRIDDGAWVTHYGDMTTFTIPDAGFHTIEYYSIDKAGNAEGMKSLDVIVNTCDLTYIGDTSGFYSDPVQLQAKLFDVVTGDPISGKTIIFTIGSQTVSVVTDSSGVASIELILLQPAGDFYTVTAVFEGDGMYLADSDSAGFTIEKEFVVLTYTGSTVIPTTVDTITLRVTVYDDADLYWGDLNKIYVTFYIYDCPMPDSLVPKESYGPFMVEFTFVDGVGVFEIEVPNLPENCYLIKVVFSPGLNDYYQGDSSDLVALTIYEPTGDFVTGGGWIWDETGRKGNFGFNVKYKKNGLPKGQAIYVYREGDWEYIIKSNAWEGMAIIGNHSFFEAKCVVQKYNSKTGELAWSEGNYRMRVDVWDEYNDEGDDVFQIKVYDKIGQIYHRAGFDPLGILQGGNIVIHTDDKK